MHYRPLGRTGIKVSLICLGTMTPWGVMRALHLAETRGPPLRPFVTSTIVGATRVAQLRTDIDSHSVTLDPAVLQEIEAIHRSQPNPAP